MSAAATDPALARRLEEARDQALRPLSRREVAEIMAQVVESMQGDLSAMDLKIYRELEALNNEIQAARREIASIRPDEISGQFIPKAADELDAVVGATEEAAGKILDSAEQVQSIAEGLDGEVQKTLIELATQIFEACNFQDITGQRIAKVVKTLKHIEARIVTLVGVLGKELQKAAADGGLAEAEQAGEEALLNGPQLDGGGIDQDEIDKLLDSMD